MIELQAANTLPVAISAVFAISIVLFVVFFQEDEVPVEAGGPAGGSAGRKSARKGIFLKLFGNVVTALGKVIATVPLGDREKVRKKLQQAGNPGALTVDEFHATRIVGIFIGAAAGWLVDDMLAVSPMFTVVLGFLGALYPGIWLNGTIQKRRRRIFRDLPDMLDILRLSTDAGLDLTSAMKVVVERGREGPLMNELELVEREISLGRTRKEAFKNFSDRIAMTEVNAFVLALVQAEQLGAPIGPVLKTQAEMARTRRWQLAEVLVNKLPMKMLGPLVVFIFPSSFIILFTPLLIQWFNQK